MTQRTAPAVAGLLLAWGGTALLVSPAAELVVASSSVAGGVIGQLALWLLCLAVIGIVVCWEKQPLTSLWLEPPAWSSLWWAGALALATIVIIFPVTEWVRQAVGLSDYAAGMETALIYPVWLRVIAVLTAGIVEETLFRGFAVTRLLRLGWSAPVAIAVSSAAFAALHLPLWGAGPSLAFLLGGLATTTFFVWRRDLLAMVLAHIAIDMWALVITPMASRWWE